jgi:hypothetical protein
VVIVLGEIPGFVNVKMAIMPRRNGPDGSFSKFPRVSTYGSISFELSRLKVREISIDSPADCA